MITLYSLCDQMDSVHTNYKCLLIYPNPSYLCLLDVDFSHLEINLLSKSLLIYITDVFIRFSNVNPAVLFLCNLPELVNYNHRH